MITFIGRVSKDVRNQAGKRRYRDVLSDTFISISAANIRKEEFNAEEKK